MNNQFLSNFVQNLINEYKKFDGDSYFLFVEDLPFEEKKLFMSHIDIREYEHFINNKEGMIALLDEYKDYMQSLIDNEIDSLFIGNMREHGLIPMISPVNGELIFHRFDHAIEG